MKSATKSTSAIAQVSYYYLLTL